MGRLQFEFRATTEGKLGEAVSYLHVLPDADRYFMIFLGLLKRIAAYDVVTIHA